jgi:hypothetical protein
MLGKSAGDRFGYRAAQFDAASQAQTRGLLLMGLMTRRRKAA